MCGEKTQQAYALTNSSEFTEATTLTLVSAWIKRCKTGTRLRNPRIQLRTGSEVSEKSVADSYYFVVCAHQPLKASLPCETKNVYVLVRMSWFASEVSRRVPGSHTNQSQSGPW